MTNKDQQPSPLVSVIMGTYNNETTIREAITSILQQSLINFELIIIDDNSSDKTPEIVQSFHDDRIILIRNYVNKGLGYSLNLGFKSARGQYIARMDADDISLPNRLTKQITFLQNNPLVSCVGSGAKKIGCINLRTKLLSPHIIPPTDSQEIRSWLLLGTPMLHPSVMFNATIMRKLNINYDPNFRRAQDYELWTRLTWHAEIRNLKDILLHYRYSVTQASSTHRKEQINNSSIMYKRMLSMLLSRPVSDDELETHILFSTGKTFSELDLVRISKWLNYVAKYITQNTYFNPVYTKNVFAYRWLVVCRLHPKRFHRVRYYRMSQHFSSLSPFNLAYLILL